MFINRELGEKGSLHHRRIGKNREQQKDGLNNREGRESFEYRKWR